MRHLRILLAALCLASAPSAFAAGNAPSFPQRATAPGDSVAELPLDGFSRFRIGGYGEAVAQFKNYGINRFNGTAEGNTRLHRSTIAIPRFVVSGDYKFNRHWQLGAEIEFEAGGTGTAYELENTENGEYETEVEKGGEVAIEQFHLTYLYNRALRVRAGHFVLPIGLTNAHHEPILFFGTVRPEGESTLLPCTWHETGLQILGEIGKKYASFAYEASVSAGLNPNGFDRNHWVQGGKQGIFEQDNFTSPAYTARLDWTGVRGLCIGASAYFCPNAGANADKPHFYNFRIPVTIWSVDAQYQCRWFAARACWLMGNVGNSTQLGAKNLKLSNKSSYTRIMPIARQALTAGGEAGLRLKGFVPHCKKMPDLVPFFRYEYYNPQQRVVTDSYNPYPADQRLRTSIWVAGINYRPLPGIVVKADYTHRTLGGGHYRPENEFALGIAFTAWYWKK